MQAIVRALVAVASLLAGMLSQPAVVAQRVPLVFPKQLPARTLEVPILMYHRVGSEPRGPGITDALTVSTAAFADEMRWLRRVGFHAITQRELFAALEYGMRLPRHPVVITFDDGYRDVLWNAAPVLHRLRMPATAYVITGRVSGVDPSFLTWDELHQLESNGFDIGSHTVHHLALTGLQMPQALAELVDSRLALQHHLGRPVPWFAYPSGRENAAVVALARRAGYLLAVTTAPGTLQRASQPLQLSRYEVLDTTGVHGLAALLGR
ncbi:MAG TPA: polysaccharide deacetylase family protein [Gaiellaceae bacterium]|nr:polysaccharide deacetylase family protein [Gaiellaceae bacterium]